MTNKSTHFGWRSLVPVVMAGVMFVHASIAIGGLSAAHWFCVSTLQFAGGLPGESRDDDGGDSCCRSNPTCDTLGRDAGGATGGETPADPAGRSSNDECPCCVLIMSAPLCGSDGPLPLLPLSILAIDSAIPSDNCHPFGWVSSLLRPPSA